MQIIVCMFVLHIQEYMYMKVLLGLEVPYGDLSFAGFIIPVSKIVFKIHYL